MRGRRSFCRSFVGWSLAAGGWFTRVAFAEDRWTDGLFQEGGFDFGTVARGAQLRHDFTLTNTTNELLSVADVRASCGCTTGRVLVPSLAPGQSTVIEAQMDTRNFVGVKATSLIVTLMTASGRQAEVRLGVRSNILSDVVLNPGWLDFGVVAQGQTSRLEMTIDRHGASAWKVVRLMASRRLSETIDATILEAYRNSQGAGYRMTVAVKPDAPVGKVREEIRIATNDPETPVVTVLVTAEIRGALSVSPSLLSLGSLPANGTAAEGRFLIRGVRPFSIRAIEGAGDGFEVTAAEGVPKPLHIVNVRFDPAKSSATGQIRRTLEVTTDAPNQPPLPLQVAVEVLP